MQGASGGFRCEVSRVDVRVRVLRVALSMIAILRALLASNHAALRLVLSACQGLEKYR